MIFAEVRRLIWKLFAFGIVLTVPGAAQDIQSDVRPSAIYRVKDKDVGGAFWIENQAGFTKLKGDGQLEVAFHAIITNKWLPGLIPVFAVERGGRVELRRRPARGQENSSEPLFFCLPPEDESRATEIAGYWDCIAHRPDGSRAWPNMELSSDGEKISGRFDQGTDYRFAYITEGNYLSNRLELKVEYIMDSYMISAERKGDQLRGTWKHTDGRESGSWEAKRESPPVQLKYSGESVALYEWQRVTDNAKRYALEDEIADPVWKRSPRPLGRVWRIPESRKKP